LKIITAKIVICFLIAFTLFSFTSTSTLKKVSIHVESKSLKQSKVIITVADIYYNLEAKKMITRYIKPSEYFVITNATGEALIYNPSKNEVFITQSLIFETEKSFLYYFLNNKLSDLGLKDLGFTLSNTRFEGKMMVTTWKPSVKLSANISKIELVHENQLPVFIAYYDEKYKLTKKIYYYDYETNLSLKMPKKVVEFNYLPKADSIVNKIVYSDIKINEQAQSTYFNYKIPANAKVVK